MNDDNDENDLLLPSFSGNVMPLNISVNNDDDVDSDDEITRRIGFTPALPSFGSTSLDTLAPPSLGGLTLPGLSGNITISTLSSKQAVSTAPFVSRTPAPSPVTWNLEAAPTVPPFGNPLEPTSVFVPHTSASIVSNRVSAILQERNIQVEYERNEAECLTEDHVEFSVFLYSGKEKYCHGIIVEVQRFDGNSATFYEDSKAILDSVQETEAPPKKKAKTILLLDEDDDESVEECSEDVSLAFALKMLQGVTDVQLLGLQTLSSMTNAEKIGRRTASSTCSMLARPESEVLQKLFDLVKSEEDEPSILVQAMIVLSNITSCTPLPLENIRQRLITFLNSNRPQMALLAAKCFAMHQVDSDVADALRKAQKLGQERHQSDLFSLSSKLLRNYT